jgi:hypothetical protein
MKKNNHKTNNAISKKRNAKQLLNRIISFFHKKSIKTITGAIQICQATTFTENLEPKTKYTHNDPNRHMRNHGTNKKIAHSGDIVTQGTIDEIASFRKPQLIHKTFLIGKKRCQIISNLGIQKLKNNRIVFVYGVATY